MQTRKQKGMDFVEQQIEQIEAENAKIRKDNPRLFSGSQKDLIGGEDDCWYVGSIMATEQKNNDTLAMLNALMVVLGDYLDS